MQITTLIRGTILLIALTGFISVAHAQAPMTINFPGGGLQGASAVNNRGQIVGYSPNSLSFLYEAGVFSTINISPAGLLFGISDSGQTVGTYLPNGGGFLDNSGVVTPIANSRSARGISSNGAYIVGATGNISLAFPGGLSLSSDGFLYTGGVFTNIEVPSYVGFTQPNGVNNSGQIVGTVAVPRTAFQSHGFLDNAGVFTLLDFPGAISTQANGINNYGAIVGSYTDAANKQHGFVYNGGVYTSFDFPGATSTLATGINDNGGLVGRYDDGAGNYHGFFYPAGSQGYVNAKYLVMGVTYAPPGGSASSVSYQTTNVVGNTSTITSSFTNDVSVIASTSAGGGIFGFSSGKVTITQSSDWMQKTTTSNEVTITKTSSTTFKTPGVPTVYSPVDHDYDIIWLWLNPVAVFTLPNTNIGGPIAWNGYGYDLNDPLQDMDVWPIYVGYLNGDFGPLDAQDAGALARPWASTQTFGPGQGQGITSSDFPNILKADPFAKNPYDANSGYVLTLVPGTSPATSTDGRFTASSPNNTGVQSIPYAQAPPNSMQGIQATYQSVYSIINKLTQTSDYTYKVGFGLDKNIDSSFSGFMTSSGTKSAWTMTWQNTSQTANTNTNMQTDTAVITGPPCPATTAPCNPTYTEPHAFAIYQDNLFGTFMFWPNPYFSISVVAPANNSVTAGATAHYIISTLANAGYSGTSMTFIVDGLPAGASFNHGTVAPGSPFMLNVSTTSATPTGSYPLTISATDGSQSYFASATLAVSPAAPPATLVVSKSGTGNGSVTSSPAGIDCGATCSATLTPGQVFTLTAIPAAGSIFAGWSGDSDCLDGIVTMTAAHKCIARFDLPQWDSTLLHGDFDGDGKTDIGVYRPLTGEWFLRLSTQGYVVGKGNWYFQWGIPGDIPITGDFDGDGKTDIAVYRPTSGEWLLRLSTTGYTPASGNWYFQWGIPGDIPITGDFDGDGKTDISVYRPSTGEWFLRLSTQGYLVAVGNWYFQWGLPGDQPVAGDFDGDGRTDIAVYRPSTGEWYIRLSTQNYAIGLGNWYFQWGLPDDQPVAADFDGDGKTDIAAYRPSTGEWYIRLSTRNYAVAAGNWYYQWGVPGDVTLRGDFDGDLKTDIAVYRPSTGEWYTRLSTQSYAVGFGNWYYQWGVPGDLPMRR